jgi:hypothetical protein
MPAAQIYCLNEDAGLAGQLRIDLERRGWSVFLTLFGSAPKIDPRAQGSATIGWLPARPDQHGTLLEQIAELGNRSAQTLILVPGDSPLPEELPLADNTSLVVLDAFDYDRTFEDVFRALYAPWPSWLDVRVRPSQLSRPTGVGWWTEDVVVADERFEHVVRIGPDTSAVLIPGLSEPHHVTADRRQLLVANKEGNEIVIATVVDDMASDVRCIREPSGGLAHPHAARQAYYYAAIADTDHHRILLGEGQLHRSDDIAWTEIDGFRGPCDVRIANGLVFVADTFAHRVCAYNFDGTRLGETGQYGADRGHLAYPVGLATWRQYLFVAEEETKRLQVFEISQKATVVHFRSLGFLGQPLIRSPFGMDVNRENRLAVVDRDQRCVWLLDIEQAMEGLALDG